MVARPEGANPFIHCLAMAHPPPLCVHSDTGISINVCLAIIIIMSDLQSVVDAVGLAQSSVSLLVRCPHFRGSSVHFIV